MDVLIPDQWKLDVCAVLQKGDRDKIDVKWTTAQQPFMDAFPNATSYDLFDTIIEALSQPAIMGRHVTDMREPGETYTFKFSPAGRDFLGKDFLGKICLAPHRQSVIIYSAHISLKGDKL